MAAQTSVPAPETKAPMAGEMTQWPGAWGIYKTSAAAVKLNIGVLAALVGISILLSMFQNGTDKYPAASWVISLVVFLVSLVLSPAQLQTFIKSAQGKKTSFKESIDDGLKYAWRVFLLGILTGLSVIGGLILLIIPGIIIGMRLSLAQYYLVDQDMGVMEAYKASWHATKGQLGKVWGIIGVTLVFGLACLLIFGIYFIIMYSAATAVLYVYLANKTVAAPAAPVSPTPAA